MTTRREVTNHPKEKIQEYQISWDAYSKISKQLNVMGKVEMNSNGKPAWVICDPKFMQNIIRNISP
jgi:hypothetical protein